MRNLTLIDAKFWATLFENPWEIVVHLLDILIVAYFIYRLIRALAGTKIMSLIQGVVLFILLKFVAEWIGFTTITYLMNQVITYGVIAGVVIFVSALRLAIAERPISADRTAPVSFVFFILNFS